METTIAHSKLWQSGSGAAWRGQRATASRRFELGVVILSGWLLSGLYLDGFVHHNFPWIVDTFFAPWHAYLYAGYAAVASLIVGQWARNVRRGMAWRQALPAGYGLSVAGVAIFMLGGVGDMAWHEVFGFEENLEALLSPSHLTLAASGFLIVSGPLRSAWRRAEVPSDWRNLLPAVFSLLYILSLLTFFTEYANAFALPTVFVNGPAGGRNTFYHDVQAIASVFVPAALTTGLLLFAMRRWRLPHGSIALILGGNALLMAVFHAREIVQYPQALLAALVAAVVLEAVYRWLAPSAERIAAQRIFAALVPLVQYGLFFAVMVATAGVWWSVSMWAGAVVQAGVIGLLLSYQMAGPATSVE